tara:strand:+ start:378 stop:578 length:201 start_codon:yes stop_codon:yes gene_type:complete
MTLEEYVNKRVNEEDDLKGLAKELLTNYYEGWSKEELADLGIKNNEEEKRINTFIKTFFSIKEYRR